MTTAQPCRCRKRRFSHEQAERVVLDAKIARGITKREWRREEHAYSCSCDAAIWHVTSRRKAAG